MSDELAQPELLPSGPNGFITFMYYIGLTSLILSLPIAQLLHLDLGTSTPYQYAVVLGGVGGVWGAYFNRSMTLKLTSQKPQEFLMDLETKLTEMGFTDSQQQGAIGIYSPPPHFRVYGWEKIRVLVREKQIKIVGRAVHLGALKKLLHHHLPES